MTPISDSDIVSAAAQASVPPSLLMGMVRQAGVSGTLNLPDATIQAYGITAAEIAKDPLLALSLAARVLAQQFKTSGDWESALSKTLTGDANSSQGVTTSVGGQVQAILGWAATNPTFGFDSYTPTNPQAFTAMASGLGDQFTQMVQTGGVMDRAAVEKFNAGYRGVAERGAGNVPFRANASTAQAMTDVMHSANIPVTQANLAFLETMARGEGMDPSTYNWLATTQGQGQNFNSVGVKIFGSYQEGVQATASTLLNGNYARMVQLMRQGADLHTLASDPEVQRNLETWQGGSHEDVRNLLRLANLPGKPIDTQQPGHPTQEQRDQQATPDKVGEFASQLQAKGIDPDVFNEHFAWLAAQRRRLMGEKITTVADFAPMAMMTREQMHKYLLQLPHSQYPSLTVEQMQNARAQAELLSVLHTKRMPAQAEVARFAQAGISWREIDGYYQAQMAQKQQQQQPRSTVQPHEGNVVQMPNQQQGKEKQMERSA